MSYFRLNQSKHEYNSFFEAIQMWKMFTKAHVATAVGSRVCFASSNWLALER